MQTPADSSLAASLVPLIQPAPGSTAPHPRALQALLGIGAGPIASRSRPSEAWNDIGQDLSLGPLAASLNIALRDLHPLDSAAFLDRSDEFPEHYQDSYVPLMRRALSAGQRLLVWCGWSAGDELSWGVIDRDEGTHFSGHIAGDLAERRLHRGTAYQVYVVEETGPARWPLLAENLDSLWVAAAARRDGTNETLLAEPIPADVILGREAFCAWCDAIERLPQQSAAPASAAGMLHLCVPWATHICDWDDDRPESAPRPEATRLRRRARAILDRWTKACTASALTAADALQLLQLIRE